MMKAFYCLWPNFGYIDKLIDAGIDTLLITAHDLPFETPSNYYDTQEIILQTISRYRGRCSMLLVPLWARPWVTIPPLQQWVRQDGSYCAHTPCPTSRSYMRSRVIPAIEFAVEHGMEGIIWDLEHLDRKSKPDIISFYDSMWEPEHRCNCATCQQYNMEDLWKTHASAIRELLENSGLSIHGQMPYTGGWTMRQFPNLHHFTEETYQKDVGNVTRYLVWEYNWKKAKVNPVLIPGIWCEFKQTEEALINYIKKIYYKYDHFWLYSHEFFGNHIPNPHVDYPMKGPATDWFFEQLKQI